MYLLIKWVVSLQRLGTTGLLYTLNHDHNHSKNTRTVVTYTFNHGYHCIRIGTRVTHKQKLLMSCKLAFSVCVLL